MYSIRENVFETNSSSCHSLTFSTEGDLPKTVNFHLDFAGGSYQWEFRTYHDPQSKFSYWLNAFAELQSVLLREKNAKLKGSDYYYITEYMDNGWGKTSGPSDKGIYEEVLKEAANHLEKVLKAFEEIGVQLHFTPYEDETHSYSGMEDNIDSYIEYFLKVNQPKKLTDLCRGYFNFIVDLGDGIDHQSGPKEDSDCRRLAEFEPKEVLEWVLGDGYFETGNDNC